MTNTTKEEESFLVYLLKNYFKPQESYKKTYPVILENQFTNEDLKIQFQISLSYNEKTKLYIIETKKTKDGKTETTQTENEHAGISTLLYRKKDIELYELFNKEEKKHGQQIYSEITMTQSDHPIIKQGSQLKEDEIYSKFLILSSLKKMQEDLKKDNIKIQGDFHCTKIQKDGKTVVSIDYYKPNSISYQFFEAAQKEPQSPKTLTLKDLKTITEDIKSHLTSKKDEPQKEKEKER